MSDSLTPANPARTLTASSLNGSARLDSEGSSIAVQDRMKQFDMKSPRAPAERRKLCLSNGPAAPSGPLVVAQPSSSRGNSRGVNEASNQCPEWLLELAPLTS